MKQLEPARAGLQKIAQSLLRDAPAEEAPVIAWPLACGAQVAGKSRALRFSNGVLTVEAPDEAWRGQLRDMAASYLAALNTMLGGRVRRVEFVLPAASRESQ